MEHGQRVASYDTSPVVSGGVDCRRRPRIVYDKKPQRYAEDNRTAHLTAHSDKSVAYVTNNNRLYSTFCTVEANYLQTQSIARPLCDSRATCIVHKLPTDEPTDGRTDRRRDRSRTLWRTDKNSICLLTVSCFHDAVCDS